MATRIETNIESLVGKVIASIEELPPWGCSIVIHFTDGTSLYADDPTAYTVDTPGPEAA